MTQTIGQALDALFDQIDKKKNSDPKVSYSASLVQGGAKMCAKKMGEEAVELALALVSKNKDEIKNEAADLLYHFAASIIESGIDSNEIAQTLKGRQAKSGHQEKAERGNK